MTYVCFVRKVFDHFFSIEHRKKKSNFFTREIRCGSKPSPDFALRKIKKWFEAFLASTALVSCLILAKNLQQSFINIFRTNLKVLVLEKFALIDSRQTWTQIISSSQWKVMFQSLDLRIVEFLDYVFLDHCSARFLKRLLNSYRKWNHLFSLLLQLSGSGDKKMNSLYYKMKLITANRHELTQSQFLKYLN